MKNFVIQPPDIVRWLFAKSLWQLPPSAKSRLCLTFDDGPVPEQTPWVLDELDRFGAKATFFCVGDNVRKYPDIFQQIVQRGHVVGNHTFHHMQLFRSTWRNYATDIRLCSEVEQQADKFFRPPHGQMWPWCTPKLAKRFTRTVFWDVMPKDYDKRLTPQQVFENILNYTRRGSIIVLHDSVKAGERMRFALTKTLEHYTRLGYEFVTLEQALNNTSAGVTL